MEPKLPPDEGISYITSLDSVLSDLPSLDKVKLDSLLARSRMLIPKIFGDKAESYLKELLNIRFYPRVVHRGREDEDYGSAWETGKGTLKGLYNTMIEDLNMTRMAIVRQSVQNKPMQSLPTKKELSNKVFVVHGHDNEMKEAVARTLVTLGLEPVILHEQPNEGRTVIEKFTDNADVGFAIVLLSPDDMAFAKGSDPSTARPRARQNVVLELGFFLGKLQRSRVLPLFKVCKDFEMPSDYQGVIYKPFDDHGAWRFELGKELRAVGYSVDLNKL